MYDVHSVGVAGIFSNEESIGTVLRWGAGVGFGELTIRQFKSSGTIIIDSEAMSREFVKEVLCKLVDNAKLEYE